MGPMDGIGHHPHARTGTVALLTVVLLAAALSVAVARTTGWPVGEATLSRPGADPPVPGTPADDVAGPRLVPSEGALLGLWTKPRTGDWLPASHRQRWARMETAAGRRMDIGHTFHAFEATFPTWLESWHLAEGRIPMISWAGGDTTEVLAGRWDPMLAARATAVAALGHEVFLRFHREMDGAASADIVGTPQTFVAAWRHVVDLFRAQGAHNAVWVWCPNASAFEDGTAESFYPGDDHVDWVCADGYSWAPGVPGARFRPVSEIFAAFHRWGQAHGTRPLMIGETGVQEAGPGDKPAWLRAVGEDLRTDLPLVRAFVYFDSDSVHPWWLDSSPAALQAWQDLAQHPHFAR